MYPRNSDSDSEAGALRTLTGEVPGPGRIKIAPWQARGPTGSIRADQVRQGTPRRTPLAASASFKFFSLVFFQQLKSLSFEK
jgi:hypothetical protein